MRDHMPDRCKHKYSIQQVLIFTSTLLFSSPAWGLQQHGGAEGLVSHQLGHLLFTIGMLYLLSRIRKEKQSASGWKEFRGFLWCITLWNILTFCGHWLYESAHANFIMSDGRTIAFAVHSPADALFYLSHLDHLFLLPALFLLLTALRKWSYQS